MIFVILGRRPDAVPWFLSGRKEDENEAHQNYVRQNNKEGREHDGAGGGSADAFGPAACPHSLISGNGADNQAVYHGFERRRKEIAKRNAADSGVDKKLE